MSEISLDASFSPNDIVTMNFLVDYNLQIKMFNPKLSQVIQNLKENNSKLANDSLCRVIQ